MDKKTTFRRIRLHIGVPVVAAVSAVSLAVPMAVSAQEVDVSSDAVVVAVADSDGSTDNIDEIIEQAEAKGAEVELVKPDGSETVEGSDSSESSTGSGSPDSDDGDVERDIDGDLLEDEALAGVELMEPKVEDALSSVGSDKQILVVADGYGAGAAGNVLEKIAYDEGPVEKDRILGHILMGDPYRTGSASEQSASRADFSNASSGFSDSSSTGFREDESYEDDDVDDLEADDDDDLSDADRDLQEQFQADASDDSDVDRVGERNNDGESYDDDDDSSSGGSSGFDNENPDYGENDGRQVVPNYREQYGENPESNTYTPTTKELTSAAEADRDSADSDAEEPSEDGSAGGGDTGESADSAGSDSGSGVEDNYEKDDFDPGNGTSGQDVQEDRPENPGAINGEGSIGDSGNWAADTGGEIGRLGSERGVTSSDASSLVTTSGTGILGQRERGFGDLEDSTLSICSAEDGRCASSGIPSLVVDVLTGDLEKTPELAQKVLRGLVALGKLISSVDKSEAANIGAQSVKCGASIATVSVAGSAGIASVSTGVASPAAVPALAGAAVAAGGAAQSCGRAAESSLNMAADIYREYRSNPDLIQAAELIALIDPDSATYQKIKSKLPVEMSSPVMEEVLRRMAKIGYALDNIRADEYMEAYADGAGQISDLNAVGIASILTTSLSLTDAIVKAVFDTDETIFGTVAEGLGGAIGGSSIINMLGTQSGRMLTQVGASYPGSPMDNNTSSDTTSTTDTEQTENFNYADMDVGEGLSAIQFASEFASDALS